MRGHHNWHKRHADAQPLGNRVADALANLIGSWKFIIFQSVIFVIWVFVNTLWLFDAYRFDRGARIAVSRRDDFFGGFSRLDGLAGPGDMEAVIGAGCGAGPVCDTDQRHAETPQICVDLRLPRNIEMGGAFIEEQQFRLSIEGAGKAARAAFARPTASFPYRRSGCYRSSASP